MTPLPPKICIADDEPFGRQLLVDLLKPEGYRLVQAVDGEDAVRVAQAEVPDLILLDVMMPRLNGFEACARLRLDDRLRHVPILMLTALDDRRSRLRGLEAGADDFLTKPLDGSELRTRVRTITRLNRFRLLSEERERFASAVALSPNGIVITSPEGATLFSNEAYHRLLASCPAGNPPPGNFFDTFDPGTAAELRRRAAQVLGGGKAETPLEITLPTASRAGPTIDLTIGRLPWGSGEAVQFILCDISERKRLEAQLLRSQRTEVLGQLASGIVHDVNNGLTAIIASAHLLKLVGPEKAEQLIANIAHSAERGANLLRQILLFARGSDSAMVEILPGQIVAEVGSIIRDTIQRTIKVHVEVSEGCPALVADPNQLHQILMNLCVNARDAMPGGGQLSLTAAPCRLGPDEAAALGGAARAGDYVVLAVRDTGTGIPPEIRARLFDPFFTTKEAGKGTGLGLATVLRLVRRHSGFVHLETEVGVGTCFHCYLSIHPEPANAATAS
ncbi:MAG: response regulator [Verrucomicrobia bacterium]|nr:response regulator [Verrucomicrobiota bacterium]